MQSGILAAMGQLSLRLPARIVSDPLVLIASLILFALFYQLSIYFYNIFLHPLRRYPGPWTSAASNLPLIRKALRGEDVQWLVSLHERYGEVVRCGSNELSFSGGDAWKDIYGHKNPLLKDPKHYKTPATDVQNLVSADAVTHSRMRRIFNNAFSDRALKLQEPLFLGYVDKLVARLRSASRTQTALNLVNMYSFCTFDIMVSNLPESKLKRDIQY